jgi:hypothetical protein
VGRPRMSAREQLERMRRNQERGGRPLPRPASPSLLILGRTLSPTRRQPDMEQRVRVGRWGGTGSFTPTLRLSLPLCEMGLRPYLTPSSFPDSPHLVLGSLPTARAVGGQKWVRRRQMSSFRVGV